MGVAAVVAMLSDIFALLFRSHARHTRRMSSPSLAASRRTIAPQLIAILIALQGGAVALSRWLLPQPVPRLGVADQLIYWDGQIYAYIAAAGYSWNPPVILGRTETLAFFPGQPLIDNAIMRLTGAASPLCILLESLLTGLLSIIAFERLAKRLLAPRPAALATIVFALWPASCFYDMGYPTGLISICIIAALSDHLAGRDWRAAAWLGLGSGIAPTVIFVGFAIGVVHLLRWEHGGAKRARLLPLLAWGVLALWGPLGFMLYQAIRFHDAFAFISAQAAWGTAPRVHFRCLRLIDAGWYLCQPAAGIRELRTGYHMINAEIWREGVVTLEQGIQRLLNFGTFLLATAGLAWATVVLPRRAIVVAGAGWAVYFGYLWTIFSTDQNLLSVTRLLFPAIALCLGLGDLANK